MKLNSININIYNIHNINYYPIDVVFFLLFLYFSRVPSQSVSVLLSDCDWPGGELMVTLWWCRSPTGCCSGPIAATGRAGWASGARSGSAAPWRWPSGPRSSEQQDPPPTWRPRSGPGPPAAARTQQQRDVNMTTIRQINDRFAIHHSQPTGGNLHFFWSIPLFWILNWSERFS